MLPVLCLSVSAFAMDPASPEAMEEQRCNTAACLSQKFSPEPGTEGELQKSLRGLLANLEKQHQDVSRIDVATNLFQTLHWNDQKPSTVKDISSFLEAINTYYVMGGTDDEIQALNTAVEFMKKHHLHDGKTLTLIGSLQSREFTFKEIERLFKILQPVAGEEENAHQELLQNIHTAAITKGAHTAHVNRFIKAAEISEKLNGKKPSSFTELSPYIYATKSFWAMESPSESELKKLNSAIKFMKGRNYTQPTTLQLIGETRASNTTLKRLAPNPRSVAPGTTGEEIFLQNIAKEKKKAMPRV